MSDLAGTLSAALLAGALFAVLTAVAVALCWPWSRHLLQRLHPAARARIAFGLAVAPSVAPLLLLALCFSPGVLGWLGLHADHCVEHAGHPHLCFVHPSVPLDVRLFAVLIFVLALVGLGGIRLLRHANASRRSARRLRLASARELNPGVRLVESCRPFSFATGLLRAEIFLSTALARALRPDLLEVVLWHERAHARRRDALWRLLARALSLPQLPRVRRSLLAAHELASEQACDEESALRAGDRVRVAEAILAVERLLATAKPAAREPLPAFGGSSVPERVRALLSDCAPRLSRRVVWSIAAVLGVGVCLLADPLHHATEHWLERILTAL